VTTHPSPVPAGSASVTRLGHLLYGADYNPEQWPEDVWAEDARLMQIAGVNMVSLGIFAWARVQPGPETFEFDWLDRVIDGLHEHGVAVDLATPTASPPPWLVRQHPEILPETADGVRLWHGSRRHYCPHSQAYRDAAARVARALADRYGRHPAVVLWHVDNEYSCHVGECFCERSAAAFRAWLRDRYRTLDELNGAWGTNFWSQRYGDWEEIAPPRRTPTFVNPSQALDWRRFCSDSWLACFRDQTAILREVTPDIPITTNFMGIHPPLDYWTWAGEEDVVANDSYPDTSEPDWMVGTALAYDLMRSLGRGRPWLLMEQAPAHVNWQQHNVTKRPGIMRLGSYQAVARGADGVMFFQWRASLSGAEQHHSGMIPHAGRDTRTWHEVVSLGAELARCDELVGSRVSAPVAVLFDWESLWAFSGGGLPPLAANLLPQLRAFYTPFVRHQVTVDFAHPESDLSAYRLAVVPHLYLTSDAAAEQLTAFVRNGGTVVMTFLSGIVDPTARVRPGGYPAQFNEMLGLRVMEIAPQPEGRSIDVDTADGQRLRGSLWADVVSLSGATAIASYGEDYFAGSAAITANRYGTGTAYYVGTMPDLAGLTWLIRRACATAGIEFGPELPAAVEVVRRSSGPDTWQFILNYTTDPVELPLERPGTEVLSAATVARSVRVGPLDVAIVRLDRR